MSRKNKLICVSSVLLLVACAESTPAQSPTAATNASSERAPRSHEKSALKFIDDDYPHALAEAKKRNVPLFVDAWAPWCHSCLSMREYVLRDPALSSLDSQFVFLAIDTEKGSNAPFTSKFQNTVWPTLYVIDSGSETARVKWGGTATTRELVAFLADAALANAPSNPARAAFIRGNAEVATGDLEHAEGDFRAALTQADARDSERPRMIEALTSTLWEREKYGDCVALVIRESANLPHGSSRATALATALECASEGKLDATSLAEIAIADLAHEDAELLADDRSSLFDSAVEWLDAKKDPRGKLLAEQWVAFLEGEAARAKSSEARAVFDAHRVLAYTAAGRPRDAIPMLEKSALEFPDDYNPPARLAKIYFDVKDYARARANVDLAFSRVYGPRTMRLADLGANIALAQAKREDAANFYRAAIERTRDLPLTPKQTKQIEAMKKKLSDLQAGGASPSAE